MKIRPAVIEFLHELPSRRKTTEFPTGLTNFDNDIWFLKKNLNIIAGRPSNNKSSFILNCLAVPTSESGKNVIIYSLEDTKERYVVRYLANKTSINNRNIQNNNLTTDEIKELHEHRNTMDDLPLTIQEEVGYSILEIEKHLKTLKDKPDMVIIDYLNKIKTQNNNRLESINDYLREFSNLSKKMDFCAVVCCQVNREAMVKDGDTVLHPMMHHIKESGDIEQIADVVLLIHWEYKYSGKNENDIRLIVAKNKDGETNVYNYKIEAKYNRITNFINLAGKPMEDAFQGMI